MAILRLPETKAETGFRSNTSIYNEINKGLFPRPVKIGSRASGWPDYEVRAVCAARIAGQSEEEIRELVNRLHDERLNTLRAK